jgi:tetratricopeptide (TPR) repeat protein
VRGLYIAISVLWAASVARAEDDPVQKARTHFEAGSALYRVGNYPDALREFQLGYKLAPRPRFLLNIGQCHRKLDDLPQARAALQRFLDEAPADAPERMQVKELLADVEREIATRPPKPPPAPEPVVAPPPPVAAPQPVAITAAAPPPPKKKSAVRHLAWIIPVSVVVVGAAVLGGVLGSQPSRTGCGDTGVIGCIP